MPGLKGERSDEVEDPTLIKGITAMELSNNRNVSRLYFPSRFPSSRLQLSPAVLLKEKVSSFACAFGAPHHGEITNRIDTNSHTYPATACGWKPACLQKDGIVLPSEPGP